MSIRPRVFLGLFVLALFSTITDAKAPLMSASAFYNVRDYGAVGNGSTLDTLAINNAIMAASKVGGGTVYFPAGNYLSFSIRLRSHITLELAAGATITAADSSKDHGRYDAPEPNTWGDDLAYQDFGHSHWHNSLIWGENVENVTIRGAGMIDGTGLWKGLYPPLGPAPGPNPGNKAIAIKASRNITLGDFTIFRGGHFAILATGVDNLRIEGLRIDTNRDGIDIDACRNVIINNLMVNTPNDDAIVLKSSYALGEAIATENVTISNSIVSGYDLGSMLDGSYRTEQTHSPDEDGPTGRIKFGTESNGGFKNITINNITFRRSRGLALETVDGGDIEDIAISNITMREVSSSPLFIRLGNRLRGPDDSTPGRIRRVSINNLVAYDVDPRYPAIITGLPDHPVESLQLSNIQLHFRGGLSLKEAETQPQDLISHFFFANEATSPAELQRSPYSVPERGDQYPEPSMFGILPAYGFYIRHVEGLQLRDIRLGFEKPDQRPAMVLQQVDEAHIQGLDAEHSTTQPTAVLRNSRHIRFSQSLNGDDQYYPDVDGEAHFP